MRISEKKRTEKVEEIMRNIFFPNVHVRHKIRFSKIRECQAGQRQRQKKKNCILAHDRKIVKEFRG